MYICAEAAPNAANQPLVNTIAAFIASSMVWMLGAAPWETRLGPAAVQKSMQVNTRHAGPTKTDRTLEPASWLIAEASHS